ncbi:MAG: energy transducer TonB [Janthinobacterium lividum]
MSDGRAYSDTPTHAVQPDTPKVYTYVEQMPLLNGQNAYSASIAAITHAVIVPANAPTGRVYVQFIVTKEGQVSHPHIVKSLRADLDSAVVAATRQLPRFTPGKQSNRVVAVVITVGVAFPVTP